MNNKLIKGIAQSALALSLASWSLTSIADEPGAPPTDILFGLPVVIEPGSDLILVDGGGGFGTATVITGDDNTYFDVSPVFGAGINFYGATLNTFAIHASGQVSLGHDTESYSSDPLSTYAAGPMFAAGKADLSANDGNPISPGGNSTGTNTIYYHNDIVNNIVTVTWDDIGKWQEGSLVGSAFQMRFHMLGNGNFVVENRYESVDNSVGPARLGWTNGDLINFDDPYPSGDANFGNLVATESNINHPGVFAWLFVNGQVVTSTASNKVLEKSVNDTIVGSLSTEDADVGDTFTYELLDNANGRFGLSIIDGNTYVVVIDGGSRLDIDDNETHDITVRVTDSQLHTFDKTLTVNVIKVPVFLTTSDIVVPVDQSMNLTIKTLVEQGTAIPTITATGLPAWMNFVDNADGTVTLSGYPSFELTFRVTLTVTDGLGNQTTRTFNITVEEPKERTEDSSDSTTTTVTITEEGGSSGGSFGWLTLMVLGGLLSRRKFN